MAMTPLQRKAAFRSTVTLKQMTMTEAAHHLGVSYNHLALVLAGERQASSRLKRRLGSFLGVPISELFPRPGAASAPRPRRRPPSHVPTPTLPVDPPELPRPATCSES